MGVRKLVSEHKPGQDTLSKNKLVLASADFFVPGLSALISCASLYPPVPLFIWGQWFSM